MDSESHGEWWAVGRVEKATKTDIESKQIFHTTEVKSEESSDLPKRSTTYLLVTLTILWSTLIFPLLDETMIATLLGPISISFHSLSNLSWIATTYFIGMSASNPVSGHLADVFGRQIWLTVSIAFFVIGSLMCGLSPRLEILLLGRSIQGFGSGGMQSVISFIEADLLTLRNRGIAEAVGGILSGVCLAVGGLYGGGINDNIGWKWAFLIQAPITVVLGIGAWFTVGLPRRKLYTSTLRRLDYIGGCSILLAIVFFQLGLQSGGNTYAWKSPLVLVSFCISLLFFVIFFVWDLYYAKEPLVPIRLLQRRNLYLSSIFYIFNLMSYFSIEFYVSTYLQVLRHSTTATGLRFIPQAFGAAVASFIVGVAVKVTGRYYWFQVLGSLLGVLGAGLLLLLDISSPSWYPFVFLGLTGASFGATWVTVIMAVLSSVTDEQQATVQSTGYFFRFTGMTLGLTVSTAAFQKVLKDALWSSFGHMTQSRALINSLRTDFNVVNMKELDPSIKRIAQEDYINAIHVVFYIILAEAVVAAVACFCMEENELSDCLRE